MVNLLKTFGKGFLYVLGFPFFVVALALFGAIGLLAFIFQILKSIVFFFTGHKFFPELKEDRELRLLKEKNSQANEQPKQESVEVDNSPSIITPYYEDTKKEETIVQEEAIPQAPNNEAPVQEQTIEQACFEDANPFNNLLNEQPKEEIEIELEEAEPIKEETPVIEPVIQPVIQEEPAEDNTLSTLLETKEDNEDDEEELVEQLETYVPKSSTYKDIDESDDDDDDDSGVSIDYNL